VSSGIDWVFEHVDRAIILEDDCLPDPTFFRFCDELLDRYVDNERIAMISGDNFQFGRPVTDDSYYFSYVTHVWGWATWRRSWRQYDVGMKRWEQVRETDWLEGYLDHAGFARQMRHNFDRVWRGEVDTWDAQWTLACWLNDGLTILPAGNLVRNIGFGSGATHTKAASPLANLPVEPMSFPLKHPAEVRRNKAADDASLDQLLALKNL
jgi:hypothetical protein